MLPRFNFRKQRKKSKIGTIIYNHIINNKRGYLIVIILFFIGIIAGVFYINSIEENKIVEINEHLKNLIDKIKNYKEVNYTIILKESFILNLITIILLWFGASTIIGIPIVYGIVCSKGFTLGYTISSILICFEVGKGILIAISALFLHNIIFIPAMLGASVSGVKLYQSIMKNKDRNNMKIEILRHTIFCILMLLLMLLSSIIEVYGSTNLLIFLLKTT